jgi:hypothetical protein
LRSRKTVLSTGLIFLTSLLLQACDPYVPADDPTTVIVAGRETRPSPDPLFPSADPTGVATQETVPASAPSNASPTTTASPAPSPTLTWTATSTQPTPTDTVTYTPNLEPSQSPTATFTPGYVVLRGKVLKLSNCRYGPGAAYLYKYGLVEGSNLEVIGRNELGTWLMVRAIGGSNPCWLSASLMDVNGEVLSLGYVEPRLPFSPYYSPLEWASASRAGATVSVSWSPMNLRAGDDSEQYPYLLEAWVCQSGEFVFLPLGSYQTTLQVTDQHGCSQPSHARVYGVEKHGYTAPIEVPWP